MKLRSTHPAPASPSTSAPAPAGHLVWCHQGVVWRVTAWPEAEFQCGRGTRWRTAEPTDGVFAAAAVALTTAAWRSYLEFVPPEERQFLGRFGFGRLEGLWVLKRCPALLGELATTPALTAFVAAHAALRGTPTPRWAELQAVHEHGGLFKLLEWLGLPASRETLAALQNVVDPDVPRCLIQPLRSRLWRPAAVTALCRKPLASDRELARFCHALAA